MYNEYLEKTEYMNYDALEVKRLAECLKAESTDELSLIKNAFYYVRDEIKHSRDVYDKQVTVTARIH